jgi:Ca2+-binding protein (EF-Hand superfamily)
MLSTSGRQRLKTLFIEISKHEQQLEVLREILGEQYEFEPYAAFRRLDRKRKGFVTANDIREFLLDHEHRFHERDCANYIDRYDLNGDGNLSYHE